MFSILIYYTECKDKGPVDLDIGSNEKFTSSHSFLLRSIMISHHVYFFFVHSINQLSL